jgi:hypothetical protein
MFFPAVLFSVFSLFCCVFSLCCYLSLASSMAVAWLSLFRICSRNSVCRLDLHWPLPTVASWWSQWGSCDREFTIIHVTVDPWRGVQLPLLFILQVCLFWFFVPVWFLFYGPLFSVLSILLWKFLWLNEEVLTWLCFFLIVRMEISYER